MGNNNSSLRYKDISRFAAVTIVVASLIAFLMGQATHAQEAGGGDGGGEAVAVDFNADVSAGQQDLAQDPGAQSDQVAIVDSEDQSAGDASGVDLNTFPSPEDALNPAADDSTVSTSDVDATLDANDTSEASQEVINQQEQQDEQVQAQAQEQEAAQEQTQQDEQQQQQQEQDQQQQQQQEEQQQQVDQQQQDQTQDSGSGSTDSGTTP